MAINTKLSRRQFTGAFASAASYALLARSGRSSPAETMGIGMIGVGGKGRDHLKELLTIRGVQIRGICDIYSARLESALAAVRASNPTVTGYNDYRKLLESKDIQAIVIATPDHWHAKMAVDAAQAGKDLYVEKGLCRSITEAKAIARAVKENRRVFQLGHQRSSDPVTWKAGELYASGAVGKVSLVKISRFRNSRQGEWNYNIPADAGPQNIDWRQFLGSAPARPFEAERFFRWRKYWDYGTGISGDLLSHEWNAVNYAMRLGIPKTCVASGGIYYWKDGREVPDVLNVLYEYPEKNLSLVFASSFSTSRCGVERETHIFGRNATLEIAGDLAMYLEPYGEENLRRIKAARQQAIQSGARLGNQDVVPVLRYSRADAGPYASHMQNFIDCVRTRERTRCNEDDGLEEAATLLMSVAAYKERRMVRWDPAKQDIV